MSHRSPYVQASSPLAGPTRALGLDVDYEASGLVNITLAIAPPYADGGTVAWGSSFDKVYKVKRERRQLSIISAMERKGSSIRNGLSGAYTVLDKDNVFYVPDDGEVVAYSDSVPGRTDSDIAIARTFTMPKEALHGSGEIDPIVGINLTWDGYLVLATRYGTIATLSRDFTDFHYVQLGDNMLGEEVSNSIAVDEDGGIFVVTSEQMYRVQWTGSDLSLDEADGAWSAPYNNGADWNTGGIRGNKGSGSTPTLMGTGDEDKFVVITDGQRVTNLILF